MPTYSLSTRFTDEDRKVFKLVLTNLGIGFPDFNPATTVSRKREGFVEGTPDEVRAFKAAALNNEPFELERVELALAAAQQQYNACVEQADPEYWKAQETPGVDPEVSARYGERGMGKVLAESREQQAYMARDAMTILADARRILLRNVG